MVMRLVDVLEELVDFDESIFEEGAHALRLVGLGYFYVQNVLALTSEIDSFHGFKLKDL